MDAQQAHRCAVPSVPKMENGSAWSSSAIAAWELTTRRPSTGLGLGLNVIDQTLNHVHDRLDLERNDRHHAIRPADRLP